MSLPGAGIRVYKMKYGITAQFCQKLKMELTTTATFLSFKNPSKKRRDSFLSDRFNQLVPLKKSVVSPR